MSKNNNNNNSEISAEEGRPGRINKPRKQRSGPITEESIKKSKENRNRMGVIYRMNNSLKAGKSLGTWEVKDYIDAAKKTPTLLEGPYTAYKFSNAFIKKPNEKFMNIATEAIEETLDPKALYWVSEKKHILFMGDMKKGIPARTGAFHQDVDPSFFTETVDFSDVKGGIPRMRVKRDGNIIHDIPKQGDLFPNGYMAHYIKMFSQRKWFVGNNTGTVPKQRGGNGTKKEWSVEGQTPSPELCEKFVVDGSIVKCLSDMRHAETLGISFNTMSDHYLPLMWEEMKKENPTYLLISPAIIMGRFKNMVENPDVWFPVKLEQYYGVGKFANSALKLNLK